MDLTSFHTALLTMVVLERQELIDAGAIGESDLRLGQPSRETRLEGS